MSERRQSRAGGGHSSVGIRRTATGRRIPSRLRAAGSASGWSQASGDDPLLDELGRTPCVGPMSHPTPDGSAPHGSWPDGEQTWAVEPAGAIKRSPPQDPYTDDPYLLDPYLRAMLHEQRTAPQPAVPAQRQPDPAPPVAPQPHPAQPYSGPPYPASVSPPAPQSPLPPAFPRRLSTYLNGQNSGWSPKVPKPRSRRISSDFLLHQQSGP